jgi:hypothetical protein
LRGVREAVNWPEVKFDDRVDSDGQRWDGWILEHRSDDGRTEIENLDGVSWHKAPVPRRFHRCRAQTRGFINYFTWLCRCACGGVSYNGRRWIRRNSRIHVRSRRHLRAMTRAKCDLEVGTGMENPLYRKFLYGAAIREAKACGCSPEFWPEALKSL